jgi:hypothetical protein
MRIMRGLHPTRRVMRRHVTAFTVVSSLLALAAMFGVAQMAGLDRVRAALVSPQLEWLPVAFAGVVISYAGYLFAYREVTQADDGERLSFRHSGALVASGFGLFLVGGGFAADLEAQRQRNVSQRTARIRVLGLGALEYAVLAPAACVCAAILVVRGAPIGSGLTWPWIVAVPAGAAVALAAFAFRKRLRGPSWWRRALAAWLDALAVFCDVGREPHRRVAALAGMALYWTGDILLLWATLHVFLGRAPSLPALILGYATGYALTRRTLPLAGAGVVDFLLPLALSWVSIPLASALVAVFVYRLFNLWLPLAPAVIGWRHAFAGARAG